MGDTTKIEWADKTFNPWIGCQKVSPGCDHCYAESMMDHRYGKVQWGPHGERKRTSEANWKKPLQWQRAAETTGTNSRVFCASLADVFDNRADPGWRDALWYLIRQTPDLRWLLLTKRPENIRKMLPNYWPLLHVWLGTTAEDQERFERRWEILHTIPAKVHFISYEPAIGPLSVKNWLVTPEWIICGGESGPGARHMDPQWSRDLRDECDRFGIPFFMKQMTGKAPIPTDLLVRQFPTSSWR